MAQKLPIRRVCMWIYFHPPSTKNNRLHQETNLTWQMLHFRVIQGPVPTTSLGNMEIVYNTVRAAT